jgi:hypothetical protein
MHDRCMVQYVDSETEIKSRAPVARLDIGLSTVRDHEGAGQLDPQTVANSNTVRRPNSQFKPLTTSDSAERGGPGRTQRDSLCKILPAWHIREALREIP